MAFLWNMLWAELNSLQIHMCVCAKLLQSCSTLCDPMDCSLPVSSVRGILQAIIQVGSHSLHQGIFPTQGLNLGFQSRERYLTTETRFSIYKLGKILVPNSQL